MTDGSPVGTAADARRARERCQAPRARERGATVGERAKARRPRPRPTRSTSPRPASSRAKASRRAPGRRPRRASRRPRARSSRSGPPPAVASTGSPACIASSRRCADLVVGGQDQEVVIGQTTLQLLLGDGRRSNRPRVPFAHRLPIVIRTDCPSSRSRYRPRSASTPSRPREAQAGVDQVQRPFNRCSRPTKRSLNGRSSRGASAGGASAGAGKGGPTLNAAAESVGVVATVESRGSPPGQKRRSARRNCSRSSAATRRRPGARAPVVERHQLDRRGGPHPEGRLPQQRVTGGRACRGTNPGAR